MSEPIPPVPEGTEPVWVWAISMGKWIPAALMEDGALAFQEEQPFVKGEALFACARVEGDDEPPDPPLDLPSVN